MSVDHASGVAAPKADPVFLHVRAGMTVIVDDGSDWRMADVIWVDGGARNPSEKSHFRSTIRILKRVTLKCFCRAEKHFDVWGSTRSGSTMPASQGTRPSKENGRCRCKQRPYEH